MKSKKEMFSNDQVFKIIEGVIEQHIKLLSHSDKTTIPEILIFLQRVGVVTIRDSWLRIIEAAKKSGEYKTEMKIIIRDTMDIVAKELILELEKAIDD